MRVSTVYLVVDRAGLLLAAAWLAACAGDIEAPLRTTTGAVPDAPATAAPTTTGVAAAAAGSVAPPPPPAASTPPVQAGSAPYSELPDGRGGTNLEQVVYPMELGFDKALSKAAFERTLYPVLRANCAACHSTDTRAQAPIHADVDVDLAHEYALTRVNFYHPEDSKLVVRMVVDRHNCFGRSCNDAGLQLLQKIQEWVGAVQSMLPQIPRGVPEGTMLSEAEITQWIAADRVALPAASADYIQYVSLHELHNAGVSAQRLNVARAAVSKALNSTARWAPKLVSPVDINGKGMVYRFDIRDYWGHNKGVNVMAFGGSDDDIFFGDQTQMLRFRYNFAPAVTQDPAFAQMVWGRIKEGSKDAYRQDGAAANNKGFKPEYVEASQLVYTLSRADVYHAIMAIPVYAPELERELGVVKDADIKSYEYSVVEQAITIDSRMMFRAKTSSGGFYWKTFDIFTGNGQVFPFWEHPIPKFVSAAGATPRDLSLVATLLQPVNTEPSAECAVSGSQQFQVCTQFTGESGVQQSASEVIWNLPNGLQGYAIYGGLNQRRVDAFSFIVRDPRRLRKASDAAINGTGFGQDLRLTVGGSCMGCHIDGMNRASNDLRDRLDNGALTHAWVNDAAVAAQVRELYPPSSVLHPRIEDDRRPFFDAMAKIRSEMLLGPNKNLHVEPIVWAFEWAQAHHGYSDTTSN